ncbi:c-type cytochrome [Desulfovibrio sp. OttesenSCG-928-M14]|nr:c-type cytochrome [Desulfovibrio sp. OttesenSCG-928-M14]
MYQMFCVFTVLCLFVSSAMAGDGESIYKASCAGCHGVDGSKSHGGSTSLRDQSAEEIAAKLEGYAKGEFGGKQKHIMQNIVSKHSIEELKGLSEYAATL